MGMKELRAALGLPSSASSRATENAAIRQWMPGGDHLLDALHQVDQLRIRLSGPDQTAAAQRALAALDQLQAIRADLSVVRLAFVNEAPSQMMGKAEATACRSVRSSRFNEAPPLPAGKSQHGLNGRVVFSQLQ